MERNQNTFEHVKVKAPPKPHEPTKEERQYHEATHCPFPCMVVTDSIHGRPCDAEFPKIY